MGTRRIHGGVAFTLMERGRYAATAPWGAALELERRRYETSAPAGWYLFGELPTGAFLDGRWMGELREEAMAAVTAWLREIDSTSSVARTATPSGTVQH